jgi:hypothetical protein
MYIHELARRIRLRSLGDPKVGAGLLIGLSLFNATTVIHEIPRAPQAATVSRRPDEDDRAAQIDGPESHPPQLVSTTVAEPMPPGRGMTWAMAQEAAFQPNQGWIASAVPERNSVLLDCPAAPIASSSLIGSEPERTAGHPTDGPERDRPSPAATNTTITPDPGALKMSHHPNFLRAPPGLWRG